MNHSPLAGDRHPRRIGVFGGSFDPVHWGHLWIAAAAHQTLGLDVVKWIPAATSPLKPNGPVAGDDQRLAMLRLAISGDDRFEIDERELSRGDVSYTVDTLAELVDGEPEADWFLIIGGDSLATLDRWNQPGRIAEMATIAPVRRGGEGALDYTAARTVLSGKQASDVRANEIPMPAIEISSREIRARVESGQSIRYLVPAAVEALIEAELIYRPAASPQSD